MSQSEEASISGHSARVAVHSRGNPEYDLSPLEKFARPLDPSHLARWNNRYRGGNFLAAGCRMGSLARSCVACFSRCRERTKLTVGCHPTRRASFGGRLSPATAADLQVFSKRST